MAEKKSKPRRQKKKGCTKGLDLPWLVRSEIKSASCSLVAQSWTNAHQKKTIKPLKVKNTHFQERTTFKPIFTTSMKTETLFKR